MTDDTFPFWLARQIYREDEAGDYARAALHDYHLPLAGDFGDYFEHLRSSNYSTGGAFFQAWLYFKGETEPPVDALWMHERVEEILEFEVEDPEALRSGMFELLPTISWLVAMEARG